MHGEHTDQRVQRPVHGHGHMVPDPGTSLGKVKGQRIGAGVQRAVIHLTDAAVRIAPAAGDLLRGSGGFGLEQVGNAGVVERIVGVRAA